MLGFLGFKSKPKITEKMLEQYNINIIKYADIKIDKTPIATTGSGIFYKGTYQNEAVSISPEVLINKGINVNMLISSSLIISLLKVGLKLLLSILE